LAIWAVMIVSSIGGVIVVSAISPTDLDRLRREPAMERFLEPMLKSASDEAKGLGEDGLVESIRQMVRVGPVFPYLLQDAHGKELLRGGSSEDGDALISDDFSENAQRFEFQHDDQSYVFSAITRDRAGKPIQGSEGLLRSFAFLIFRSGYSWLILLIAIPISIFLSILIARYLVKPLTSFERAGQRLSEGDLTARIGPSVATRGDEIAEFAATFDQMAARIELLVRSHKELLRDVSHELRSPLARAHAALSLARQRTQGAVDPELNRIELEFDRLDSLIQKLLTFARLDAKEFSLQKQSLDVGGLLSDVIRDCATEVRNTGKEIQLHEDSQVNIDGDPELLASCFENLVRNAARHTPDGSSVEISVYESVDAPGFCEIDIRDDGVGIPDDELGRIFEPFYKVGGSGSDQGVGSGIGLAIVQKAVAIHGGTVSATNVEGGGLKISVRLPLAS